MIMDRLKECKIRNDCFDLYSAYPFGTMSADSSPRKMKRFSESDRSSEFDAATQKALEEIDICQNEIDNINEKASEEILKVEQKFNQLRKPFFDKRNLIISNIPNFWITAIMNHPDLSALMDESEEDCLHHLTKLEVEEFEDIKSGYWIKFYFEENPYFENAVITKEYHLGCATPTSESTQIQWKEGCTLGQNVDSSPTGRKRRHGQSKTFFGWFNDNVDPYTDDIAEVIKDDLWLNPLQYYLVPDIEGDGENGVEGDDGGSSSDNEEAVEDAENLDALILNNKVLEFIAKETSSLISKCQAIMSRQSNKPVVLVTNDSYR
ncbi:hypothetical protein JTB14_013489 [Gonioctena quinquepunctata]|nr:hypothetical protein JTB14_013489 [Gonioctena quinquepunctata]